MSEPPLHVVTGAFGYTGRYIARDLLRRGMRVRTLTNSIDRGDPFDGRVEVHPIDFTDRAALEASLSGAAALHNTYWVRYDHSGDSAEFGYSLAVENTEILFDAARSADVGKLVHVSVANADPASGWGYFRGKAHLEERLATIGIPHAIVRPTLVFGGPESVFINNIAWMLRRLPVFGLIGRGTARLSPVHVEDVARICVDASLRDGDDRIDATGPDTLTYAEMVRAMADAMGLRRLFVPMPRWMILAIGRVMGWVLHDVVITGHEIAGLLDETMYTGTPPTGRIGFREWLATNHDTMGREYVNDLARRT